jgi:hypothetical protein
MNLIEINKMSILSGIDWIKNSVSSVFKDKKIIIFFFIFFILNYFSGNLKAESASLINNSTVNEEGMTGYSLAMIGMFLFLFAFSIIKIFSPVIFSLLKKGKSIPQSIGFIFNIKAILRFISTMLMFLLLFVICVQLMGLEGDFKILGSKMEEYKKNQIISVDESFQNLLLVKLYVFTTITAIFAFIQSFSYYITFCINNNIKLFSSLKAGVTGFVKNIIPIGLTMLLYILIFIATTYLTALVNIDLFSVFINSFMFILLLSIWHNMVISIFKEIDAEK